MQITLPATRALAQKSDPPDIERKAWMEVLIGLGGAALLGGTIGVGIAKIGISAFEAIERFFLSEEERIKEDLADLEVKIFDLNRKKEELEARREQIVAARMEAANSVEDA